MYSNRFIFLTPHIQICYWQGKQITFSEHNIRVNRRTIQTLRELYISSIKYSSSDSNEPIRQNGLSWLQSYPQNLKVVDVTTTENSTRCTYPNLLQVSCWPSCQNCFNRVLYLCGLCCTLQSSSVLAFWQPIGWRKKGS